MVKFSKTQFAKPRVRVAFEADDLGSDAEPGGELVKWSDWYDIDSTQINWANDLAHVHSSHDPVHPRATLAQSAGGNSRSPTVKSPESKPKRRRVSEENDQEKQAPVSSDGTNQAHVAKAVTPMPRATDQVTVAVFKDTLVARTPTTVLQPGPASDMLGSSPSEYSSPGSSSSSSSLFIVGEIVGQRGINDNLQYLIRSACVNTCTAPPFMCLPSTCVAAFC